MSEQAHSKVSRRQFFKVAGAAGVAAGLATGLTPFGAFGQAVKPWSQSGAEEYRVIAHDGVVSVFWAVVAHGTKAAGKDLGVTATFQGPDTFSPAKEASFVDLAIAAGVDGIATTISDPVIMGPPVQRAAKAGIPVVTINVPPPGFPNIDPKFPKFVNGADLSYIGQVEKAAGENIAKKLISAGLKSGDKAVVFNHEPGNTSLLARIDGIKAVLGAAGILVKVVEIPGEQHGVSEGIISEYFRNNPDVSAAFGLGPDGTIPILAALKSLNKKPGDILVGTFDLETTTVQGIKDGFIVATVDQQQYLQGYYAVLALHMFHDFKFSPSDYNTGKGLVDASNVDQIQQLVQQGIH